MPGKQSNPKRNTLPRKSSPKGIEARFERREKHYASKGVMKGGANGMGTEAHKPGSRNPRKVGR